MVDKHEALAITTGLTDTSSNPAFYIEINSPKFVLLFSNFFLGKVITTFTYVSVYGQR